MQRALIAIGLCFYCGLLHAAEPAPFKPDPKSVQWHGTAYRYPQAGWIVLHVEGQPYERGYQHGRLMAPEILGYLRCFAAIQSPKAPSEGWKNTRTLVNALFVRRFEKEYLEEMKGIADGANAAGAKFDGRPLDLVDIVGLNCWAEIETLGGALDATPTGLEGIKFPNPDLRPMPKPQADHCSAFAATGPATADGKIVFGHITMFNLYPALYYNVWLDVKPAKGHRVLMQSYPGGIQSGMDYYMNDAGLLVAETTIRQTRFNIEGQALTSRIRQALQYADNIDQAVEILKKGNNGLYTNEWLLADIKTNEIAMFELGTHKSKLYRSSKNEWFGGTEGFYWGCNNAKDLEVRLETIPSVKDRPANLVWRPSDRDKAWLKVFAKHKGKIGPEFAKEAFTTPPISAYPSLDAKFTTSKLAKELKSVAIFGPPLGKTWQPTLEDRRLYPEIRPLVSNPWTILHSTPPMRMSGGLLAVDLPEKIKQSGESADKSGDDSAGTMLRSDDDTVATAPAWHGTILPKTDADVWLAAAFAEYEKIVSLEKALKKRAKDGKLTAEDRDRIAVELYAHRSNYLAAAGVNGDVPLAKIRSDTKKDEWYRIASGKGVLLLDELRRLVGEKSFEGIMESFGRDYAGKPVSATQFQEHAEKVSRRSLKKFFESWVQEDGLPLIPLVNRPQFTIDRSTDTYCGFLEIRDGFGANFKSPATDEWLLTPLDVTVETSKGETTKRLWINGSGKYRLDTGTTDQPRRLVLEKYNQGVHSRRRVFSVLSFLAELDQTLIVYGTQDETAANLEAAKALQRGIIENWSNVTVPIKTDVEITSADWGKHVLLIGRPDTNIWVNLFQSSWPITFGSRSFVVRNETYVHPGSAVIAAGVSPDPLNKRYSAVVLAGLSAESTVLKLPALLQKNQKAAEVLVLPHDEKPRALVLPAKELVRELNGPAEKAVGKK